MNMYYSSLSRWMFAAVLIMTANTGFASNVNFNFNTVDAQTLQINFSNNSYVTQDRAEEIAVNHIAKLVMKKGFGYFQLMSPVYTKQFVSNRSENKDAYNTKTSYGNPGNIYSRPIAKEVQVTFPRYNFTSMVKMYKHPNDAKSGGDVYSAKNVLMRITKARNLFRKVKAGEQQKIVNAGPAVQVQMAGEDASGNLKISKVSEKTVEWTNMSHEHLKNQKWIEAIRTASAAINLSPDFDVPYLNRATAYVQHGYLDKAIQDVDHALALNPNNTLALNLKGYTLAQQGKNREAITYYEKACHMKLTMACENFKEVIGYRPDDNEDRTKFYLGLAQDALNNQRWDEAITHTTHVLTLNAQSVEAYTLRGAAYTELQNLQSALQDINQAVTLNPDFAAAYHTRGRIYELMGSKTDAALEFEIACNMGLKQSCSEHTRLNAVVKNDSPQQ